MIHHIMLWAYKDEISTDERARIEGELTDLPARIPVLHRVTWGPIVGGNNEAYTHCFVMDFDDMDAVDAYMIHPAHVEFASRFRPACAIRTVTDVEVRNG